MRVSFRCFVGNRTRNSTQLQGSSETTTAQSKKSQIWSPTPACQQAKVDGGPVWSSPRLARASHELHPPFLGWFLFHNIVVVVVVVQDAGQAHASAREHSCTHTLQLDERDDEGSNRPFGIGLVPKTGPTTEGCKGGKERHVKIGNLGVLNSLNFFAKT